MADDTPKATEPQPTTTTPDQTQKKDAGKLPAHLLPVKATDEMLCVLEFGARKYEADGWRKGIAYNRVLAACYRHWSAIMRGEDRDPETGLLHAAHLMCEAAFLTEFQLDERSELDDRQAKPKVDDAKPVIEDVPAEQGVVLDLDANIAPYMPSIEGVTAEQAKYSRDRRKTINAGRLDVLNYRGFTFVRPLPASAHLEDRAHEVLLFEHQGDKWSACRRGDPNRGELRATPERAIDSALARLEIKLPIIQFGARLHGKPFPVEFTPAIPGSTARQCAPSHVDVWTHGVFALAYNCRTGRWGVGRFTEVGYGPFDHDTANAALAAAFTAKGVGFVASQFRPDPVIYARGYTFRIEGNGVRCWLGSSPNLLLTLEDDGRWRAECYRGGFGFGKTPTQAMRRLEKTAAWHERRSRQVFPEIVNMWSFRTKVGELPDVDRIVREAGTTIDRIVLQRRYARIGGNGKSDSTCTGQGLRGIPGPFAAYNTVFVLPTTDDARRLYSALEGYPAAAHVNDRGELVKGPRK